MPTLLKQSNFRNLWNMNWLPATIVLLVACLTFTLLYTLHSPALNQYGDNVWFQGDITRIYDNMTNRHAYGHYRANVHPLYSLITYPPTFLLKTIFSNDALAIQIVTTSIALLWIAGLYVALRLLGCLQLDAMIFSILGASSSAAMFWLHVPETYALSSISLMLALGVCLLPQQRKLTDWSFIGMNIITISVTITNWMAGIAASFSQLPFKRAVKVACVAILTVIALWGIQKLIFPTSEFFVGNSEEGKYIFAPTLERLLTVTRTFFSHSMVAPELKVNGLNQHAWPLLSFQSSYLGSTGLVGLVASLLWFAILGIGSWAFFTHKLPAAFKLTLGLTLLGQFGLHSLYGEETFLYTLNFIPLLILLGAIATLTPLRKVVLIVSMLLIPLLIINNVNQLKQACTMTHQISSSSSKTQSSD